MNNKQYNNVIEYTLKHEETARTGDSLGTARAIFDNMGVALPQGDMKSVYETISTDNYMGWKSCTMQEAQATADRGTAAIGISEDKIVVLSANDEEQPVTQTTSVMTISETTSAFAVDGLTYYSYSYGTTDDCGTSTNNSYTLVNGWLKLYHNPTVTRQGRVVEIPNVASYIAEDGYMYEFTNKNYWYAYELPMSAQINPWAVTPITQATGAEPTINVGSYGELTDEDGRYWIAVGPNVVNPNHQPNQTPLPAEMYGKGVLDIVLKDENGKKWYMPAVMGDTKFHTFPNGVIQTWKSFPNGNLASAGQNVNGTVAVEFIGNFNSDTWSIGLGNYSIDSIIFYPY